jgi:hypothetical protein
MTKPTKRPVHHGAVSPSKQRNLSRVSQALLAEYEELRPKAERFQVLQEQLKAALDAGTPVEPGRLLPKLRVHCNRRLVVDYIFDRLALTPKQIAELRAEAPEVRYRSLTVALDPAALLDKHAARVDAQPVEECPDKELRHEPTDLEEFEKRLEEDWPRDLAYYRK